MKAISTDEKVNSEQIRLDSFMIHRHCLEVLVYSFVSLYLFSVLNVRSFTVCIDYGREDNNLLVE